MGICVNVGLMFFKCPTIQYVAVTFPVGNSTTSYTPITILFAASGHTTDIIGVNVKVGVERTPPLNNMPQNVVDRTWNIFETVPGGSNVTTIASWNIAEELPGFTRTNCYLSHFTGGQWDLVTATAASGTGPYSISRSGITSFSPFAVANGGVSLPVSWLNFSVVKNTQHNAVLNWQVEERNTMHYTIQTSSDAINFTKIATVNGEGNGNNIYQYIDVTPLQGDKYYRLLQTETNGQLFYSKIVKLASKSTGQIILSQNSVQNTLVFTVVNSSALRNRFKIVDASGKIIYINRISNNQNQINLDNYSMGLYYLVMENGEKHKFFKL
jgi:hypothetical protein